MPSVRLKLASDLAPQVERVLATVEARLRELLPDSEIEHIGATAIPCALTKGDIDVMVRVAAVEFRAAADILRGHFSIKQPENWTSHFASFRDDLGHELPLGVQLIAKDAEADFLSFLRDYLISNPTELAAYNRLKIRHAGEGPHAYWKAKDAFFSRILASRKR